MSQRLKAHLKGAYQHKEARVDLVLESSAIQRHTRGTRTTNPRQLRGKKRRIWMPDIADLLLHRILLAFLMELPWSVAAQLAREFLSSPSCGHGKNAVKVQQARRIVMEIQRAG